MFTFLKVQNFALIEDIEIEFKTGFTAFVGETGAGKSLLVDAINILSGARSSSSYVKKGTEFADIQGGFYLPKQHRVYKLLGENDIEVLENEDILIQRRIMHDGRTICKIQGKTVPAQTLKTLMYLLVDIHGQHENSYLLAPKNHLALLDIFGDTNETKQAYFTTYKTYKELFDRKLQLADVQEEIKMLTTYEEQLAELQALQITNDKIVEIKQQFQEMKQLGKDYDILQEFASCFGRGTIVEAIYAMQKSAERLNDKPELVQRIASIYYELQDIESDVNQQIGQFLEQKQQQFELENRMETIFSAQKKYGDDIDAAIEIIEEKILAIQNIEYDLIQIDRQLVQQEAAVHKIAQKLNGERIEAADKLSQDIQNQLESLYMGDVKFMVDFTTIPFSSTGIDQIEFYIKTNVGSDFQPLAKIASGGELSRIMLAIKVIFAQNQALSTIIFDEIDTGVSGKVAFAIAKKMQVFSNKQQVFAITHLPQVLAASKQQLLIEKFVANNQTLVQVKYLSSEEHIVEVAKMLSGTSVATASVENAKQLIESLKN